MVDSLKVGHPYTRCPYLVALLKASAYFADLVINVRSELESLGLCLLYIGLTLSIDNLSDRLAATIY